MENLLCIFLILSSFATIPISAKLGDGDEWIEVFNSRNKTPDLTLQFYVQDVLAGPNATVWEVARANITSKSNTSFGLVRVFDDLITSEPYPKKSNHLGRAQGLITNSDLSRTVFLVDMIFTFDSEWFKGSSLSILGRLQSNSSVELTIAGGTGVFQMARGYVNASTYNTTFDASRRATSAVLEYHVALYHPCKR